MTGEEDERQLAYLNSPTGQLGSGYVRYGAAMYFYQSGRMSAQLLEIYRILCKLDEVDPRAVARHEGIDPDFLSAAGQPVGESRDA